MDEAVVDEAAIAAERQAAFERYVLPEIDVLHRVALSITRHRADAEDLVQDTLLRAYRAADRFDGRHPRAWLLTILRNAQLNRVRRRRPELLRDPDATLARTADTSTDGRTAEEVVIDAGFDATVETAFQALSDDFRAVVTLVDLEGLSYQEAADRLGIPVGTVMSRLHRARNKIKDRLTEAGVSPRRADR